MIAQASPGYYGDEMAANLERALAQFFATRKSDPQTAQRTLARDLRRALLFKLGGRRSIVVDRAQAEYENARTQGRKINWSEITRKVDPTYETLRSHSARRRHVRQIRSAVHSRRSNQKHCHDPRS